MKVNIIKKSDSITMRLMGLVLGRSFMNDFWTTYRLPFCGPAISHPDSVDEPEQYQHVIEHEMFHVKQFAPWYGPFLVLFLVTLFPLPILFSGRWFVEREAYLNDTQKGRIGLEAAVNVLWESYGWCWPKPLMRQWFQKRLA